MCVNRIKFVSAALAFVLIMAFIIYAVVSVIQSSGQSARRASTFGGHMPTIIIDAGHGGIDGGAVGIGNVIEKDINLEIALILRDLFVINGFEVVMTREQDISIHDPDVTGIRAQKVSDLRNRLAMTERYADNIFISIHQNIFRDPGQWGTQVFYGPEHTGSALLAELVQRNIVAMMQPENRRQHRQGQSNLFLIYNIRSPAILVECGFLSNAQDVESLLDSQYQAQIAFAIFCSTLQFLGMETPVNISAGR